ncbi:MAG TPA: hypothetical protein VKW78_14055 [Terriglobales bacterium]|nr:hypothetical protein [Terriglobales bacterium]
MKRILLMLIAALLLAPVLFAQDHAEVGVFADYVRLQHANDTGFWGLGGRAGFNVHKNVQLEAEFAYDFSQNFSFSSSGTSNTMPNANLAVQRASLRMIQGLFGPKFEVGGPVKFFVTAKGGFLNFAGSNAPANFGSVGNQLGGFVNGDTNGVFYPGGGVEFFAGPIGLRAEVGDMMYFDRGANNNLRITFGPSIRF